MLRFIIANFLLLFLFSFILFGAVVRLQPTSPSFRHQSLSLRPSDRSFNILIFSDLHFGEEEHGWGIEQDRKTLRIMDNLLDIEKPDLVVLNGDLITGENTFSENSSAYVDQIVAPMVARDVPWASTYGNHDSSYNLSRDALIEAESKYTLSHTQKGWPQLQGVTNYHVEVLDETGRAVLILWFLDSQGGSLFHTDIESAIVNSNVTNSTIINDATNSTLTNSTLTNGTLTNGTATNTTATNTTSTIPTTTPVTTEIPGVVGNRTVAWLTHTHEQLVNRHGRVLPSILFVHIPPHIFSDAQNNATFGPRRFPGLNKDAPLSVQHGLGLTDTKLVDALLGLEGLHSIHSGHDHGASWCATVEGSGKEEDKDSDKDAKNDKKFLCFARHTGQGGYGSWTRGARALHVTLPETDDGEIEVDSWVRLVNQRKISKVSLNETYGEDEYALEDVE